MIGDAVMLMLSGMGVVFLFLVLLNIAISLLAYFTRKHTQMEEEALAVEALARRKKKSKEGPKVDNVIQTAVISAAVHAYRRA